MKITDSSIILENLGYDYVVFKEEAVKPDISNISFKDIIPELANSSGRAGGIASKKLYKHQIEALNALEKGANVILISGTGSGKTEAWAFYSLKNKVKTLVIYPTLALSADQIERLEDYYNALKLKDKVFEVDRATISNLVKIKGLEYVKRRLYESLLIISNPAFLMQDLKRFVSRKSKAFLHDFLKDMELFVIDELDFYGSKGATLIMTMAELIVNYISKRKPQIVVLTATLGNPEELAYHLSKLNGRETVVIRGKPFRVENRSYLLIGKNLEKLWESLVNMKDEISRRTPEILEFIEDYEVFRRYAYKVVEILRSYGIYVPTPAPDIVELLLNYINSNEEGVTLVFTRSIRSAEKLAKTIKSKLPLVKQDLVRTHHHLISKSERREIEELARQGLLRIIVSPRTLTQGIDIGTVVRIVHYGLPMDVREFRQREGRKGRRVEIPFTESIIVPVSAWDRKLIEAGIDTFKEWMNLPLEKVFFNPKNKYALMFKALFKIKAGIKLSREETSLLKSLGLVKLETKIFGKEYGLSKDGERVWENLGFYEYGPPYGIKRVIISKDGEERFLEEVSRRDFVEKLQPGCFDPTSDSIVVDAKGARVIVEKGFPLAVNEHEEIRNAYEEYTFIKRSKWGERADLKSDYYSGKIFSQITIHVNVPTNGFGQLIEYPDKVEWIIESRTPKAIKSKSGIRLIYDVEKVPLKVKTYGRYYDYTYGYLYELDPSEDVEMLRLGLAYLMVSLRLSEYRVPLGEIAYYVSPIEYPVKVMVLWEPEPSGIIDMLEWCKVRKFIEEHEPTGLDEILLWAIDYEAAQQTILKDISWNVLKKHALKALNYIEGIVEISLKSYGKIEIPKPKRELKLLSIEIMPFSRDEGENYYAISIFDGENSETFVAEVSQKKIDQEVLEKIASKLSKFLDENFKLLHYSRTKEIYGLRSYSTLLRLVLREFELTNKLIDVLEEVKDVFKVEEAPLEKIESVLGINGWRKVSLLEVRDYIMKAKKYRKYLSELLKLLREYAEANAKTIYMLHLIANAYKSKNTVSSA